MIEIRFSTPFVDVESPITLNLDMLPFDGLTLRFDGPWVANDSPISLRFGDDGGPIDPPIDDNSIGIELGLAWLSLDAIEQLTALSNHNRAIEQATEAKWQSGGAIDSAVTLINQSGALAQIHLLSLWESSHSIKQQFSLAWALPELLNHYTQFTWLDDVGLQQHSQLAWKTTPAIASELTQGYAGHDVGEQVSVSYRYHLSVGDEKGVAWGPHLPRWICSTNYRPPEPGLIKMRFSEPWTDSASPLKLRFKVSPQYCYWDNGGGLIDANPTLPNLDFKIPLEPQVRRSYLMQPQISCIRVSDSLAVVLTSVSISQSRSQWTSSGNVIFSSRIDAERAANELLRITINGYDFYLLCEAPSERKAFGKSSYSASGRGRFAELSAPYFKAINFVNPQARSFMGLMGDIIENMGWTLVSEITDYNVPANAFSYATKTPAEALNMMASAIGAMLDIDNETKTITVIPQWPTVPWDVDNAVPDVILHDAVILDFSEKREIRPDANAVFVRGEQQGVAVKIKRTGTAGDNFAGDIVDKLITDNQAARMRGTVELANAGNKVQNSIRTKVMADLPPMRPGMLVGVRKGTEVFKSVCDGFTINARVSEATGVVTVNQTVTLLRNEVAA
ncbi:hypothetical protein [Shewanella colwelliana]|uniref:hypothetical protein n=1 Tax=Shewanella colwelliana TaxID=23 RepID=UPI0022AFEA7D|nr:hypothetical protein [Shewanella colwelliana]MCZ4339660.1 hypothetical protein [Shewanella colwelliana]